ncbi:MAG TPA: DUF1800 family protein [Candidatus Acidoferrales bacterium]
MNRKMPWALAAALAAVILVCGCGGAGMGTTPPPVISVVVSPSSANIRAGSSQTFTAMVTGTTNTAVTWQVNNVTGGNSTTGTIDGSGNYSAPAVVPTSNSVSVEAVSAASASSSGSSPITLMNPVPVVSGASPASIPVGTFSLTVTGSEFVSGAQVMFGGAALTTTFVSSTQLTATGTATTAQVGTVSVTVDNPNPGSAGSTTSAPVQVTAATAVTAAAAVRFLEQSTFGPTPALVSQVQASGFMPFLTSQFTATQSTFPDPAAGVTSIMPTAQIFFTNAMTNPDQLRQRVAFALSEIFVTSNFTVPPQGMAPYLRTLSADAFTNYETIMQDVTLSPAMGLYLNMVDNDKPNTTNGTHANENYSRELMQLFTLGLYLLNNDGTLQLDGNGNPIPTYTQAQVTAFANAYTGWTYPTEPGGTLVKHNPQYFLGPMELFENNHDLGSKTLLLGTVLPAGQTGTVDLQDALDNIFNHPNLPPFVSGLLIQHLVTSNPSPAYVSRVANVFESGTFQGIGSGQRGDMQAVIAAILLDPEARRGDNPATAVATDGHLREPILYVANVLRAFGATTDGAQPVNYATNMGQAPMRSGSVFNFFPPNYIIPGTTMLGPEFDLQTTATALVRINFVNSFAFSSLGAGTTVSFGTYANMASSNPGAMVDALNALLLHGTMSATDRADILAAVNAVPAGTNQATLQAETAIYLIASSSQYQVMH